MKTYVLRDDVPEQECNCGLAALNGKHTSWCNSRRAHGAFYYAGQDLEGHWFMPGIENAALITGYRAAQALRRKLSDPRPLSVEQAQEQR